MVVIESILCPTNFRNTLARVLFEHLNVRENKLLWPWVYSTLVMSSHKINAHVSNRRWISQTGWISELAVGWIGHAGPADLA